eukprot:m.144494 g.144494  ORF g.144494 m.144494 type:complete len:110 (-) comp52663_c0_seq5:387-716(-)
MICDHVASLIRKDPSSEHLIEERFAEVLVPDQFRAKAQIRRALRIILHDFLRTSQRVIDARAKSSDSSDVSSDDSMVLSPRSSAAPPKIPAKIPMCVPLAPGNLVWGRV